MALSEEEKQALIEASQGGMPTSEPSAQSTAATGLSAQEMTLLQEMSAATVDPNTGEVKTEWASGADPDLAVNDSVLDITDRTKLSLGNKEGQVSYLKQKYEDATFNTRGDLTVKKDGRWYYADPRGYDYAKDPWKLTQEIVSDYGADIAGPAITAGAAIGAGAVSGGMASVPGAMGGEYLRTSLGRLVGTYEADAIQQTKDIALEGMFQLAGEKFLPGVKLGIKQIAGAVEKLGLKAQTEPGAKALVKWWSSMSIGEEAAETAITYNKHVAKKMTQLGAIAGTDTAMYQQVAKKDMVENVKTLAKEAPKILSQTYEKLQSKIINTVDDSFESSIRNTAFQAYAKSVDDGIGKIIRGGEEISGPVEQRLIMEYVGRHGKLPQGTRFVLKSQAELTQAIKSTGEFGNNALKLATDKEAYGLMKQLYKNLDIAASTADVKGKAAAKNMLSFKREMGDILWSLSSKADDLGLNAMRQGFKGYADIIDQNVKQSLDKVGKGGMYSQLNSTWSQLNNELKPLTKSYRQFLENGNDAVFETFLNKYQSLPGKNGVSKNAVDSLTAAARSLGDDSAARLIDHTRTQIKITQAAAAMNPYITGKGMASLGMGIFAGASGNLPLATALAVGGAAGSPKVAKATINTSVAMWKQLQYLKGLSTAEINALSIDPVKASALINSVVDATEMSTAIGEQLIPSADAQESAQVLGELRQGSEKAIMDSMRPYTPPAAPTKLEIKARIKDIAGAGWIAAQMESEGDPGANNLKLLKQEGDPGGASFGMYMFNRENTLDYIKKSRYAAEFKGMKLSTASEANAMAAKFKEIRDREPDSFAQDQTEYKEKYITKAIKDAARKRIDGYDMLPIEVRGAIESAGVQFGNPTTQRFILDAARNAQTPAPKDVVTDIAIRKAIAYRGSPDTRLTPKLRENLVESRSLVEPVALIAGDKSEAKPSSALYKEITATIEEQDNKLKYIAKQRGGAAAIWKLREKSLNASQVREAIDFTYKQFGGK